MRFGILHFVGAQTCFFRGWLMMDARLIGERGATMMEIFRCNFQGVQRIDTVVQELHLLGLSNENEASW